jgi:putative nucleotidyltransferase with HDIG domain
MTALRQPVERPLIDLVREVVDSGEVTLPPFPAMGQKLLALFRDEDHIDAIKVSDLIYAEPAITATLMRMANSAFFGGLQQVSELNQAIARLGLKRVSTLVTTMIHKGQFESDCPQKVKMMDGLWNHAVASGLATRKLSDLAGGDPEESYLTGLLHDIGKLLALKAIDHLVAQDPDLEVSSLILNEVLDTIHAELGCHVLTEWRLPERICDAVLAHHDPAETIEDELALRLQATDAMTRKIGAHPNPDPNLALESDAAVELLHLSEVELAALLVDLEDDMKALKDLL